MLQTLHDVGLDYIKLGQPSPTLSGGEAQRIKLARELCQAEHRARRCTSSTSRPPGCTSTTSSKLLEVLHGFVDAGNTVRRDRAQPRRDQDGRLDHRPRPRRRRRRRPDRLRRHARGGGRAASSRTPGRRSQPVLGRARTARERRQGQRCEHRRPRDASAAGRPTARSTHASTVQRRAAAQPQGHRRSTSPATR